MKVPAIPEAVFDALLISDELSRIAGGAGELEIANFAYLGCLLAVYEGMPPSEWGYQFAATHSLAPHSHSLAEAIRSLRAAGILTAETEGLRLTERGRDELIKLRQLSRFSNRQRHLAAACLSASAIPLPVVTESLTAEPQMRSAIRLSSSKALLDEMGQHTLIDQFAALNEAVPFAQDLFIPAVVWLTYLSRQTDADLSGMDEEGANSGVS